MNGWYFASLISLALGVAGLAYGWYDASTTTNPDDYGGAIGGIIMLAIGAAVAAVLALIGLVVG